MADVEVAEPAVQPLESHHEPSSRSPSPTKETDNQPEVTSTELVTTNAEGKRLKKIIRKKKRPARPQVDPATFKTEQAPQTGTIFNIWYNKWSGGDREDKYLSKTHAPSRCNIARDTGYTRADSNPGSYFCLFFARGICPRGRECEYLHRLPSTYDIYSGQVDCFGRDKHSDYRDDMGGVGSFMRQNRTLYVGRIHPTDDVEEIVARHFQEWGAIERIRVLPTRGVAFVTYTTEALAQFAKEAMAHQSLDNEEILNVRWATQDPNPQAQKREARNIEEQAADAIRRALPEAFVREIEGRDPDAKRRRKEEGSFGLKGYDAPDDVWFQREKALELENMQRAGLLEAPDHDAGAEDMPQSRENEESENAYGLLSASTLAALNSYQPERNAGVVASKDKSAVAGPLVGYGSDEDDED